MIVNFDFNVLTDLIRRKCGLVKFDPDLLARAVLSRSQFMGTDPNRYHIHALNNGQEVMELAAILTVNESYFYRAHEQVQLMAETLVPALLKSQGTDRPINIMSAGCSTGEEPYSIAITLRELFGPAAAKLFRIHGYDLDAKALEKAQSAQYSKFSLRAIPQHLISRYFNKLGSSYQLVDAIRRMVSFRRINLTDFPPATTHFNFIFFRNVALYLDRPAIQRVQLQLLENMTPDGVLFVGAAESAANDLGIFQLIHNDGQFYFARRTEKAALTIQTPPSAVQSELLLSQAQSFSPLPNTHPRPDDGPIGEASLWRISHLIRAGVYESAERALARLKWRSIEQLTLESFLFFQTNRLDLANKRAAEAIDFNFWSLEASLLSGLIAQRQEDFQGAISWFRRALYECPTNWPANFFLAELYRRLGEGNSAAAHYRRTLNEIHRAPDPDGGLYIPLDFPLQEALNICRSRLAEHVAGDVAHAS